MEPAAASIDYTPVNDDPTAQDDELTTDEDTPLAGSVLADNENGADSDPEDDDLTVSDIDRLLAALYDTLYGDRAECRARCRACGDRYEFTLSLGELVAQQDAERPGAPDEDGAWTLPDGRRVRAPHARSRTGGSRAG